MPAKMNLGIVLIRRLVGEDTVIDPLRGQAIGTKTYEPPDDEPAEQFWFQVAEDSRQRRVRTELGALPTAEGHLVYPVPSAASLLLKRGDRIVGLPTGPNTWDTVDFTVTNNGAESYLNGYPLLYYADYVRSDEFVNSK